MNWWSCHTEIADPAKYCPFCEAEVVAEPSEDELAAAANALAGLSPEVLSQIRDAFEESATGEEFVDRILVGDCPQCGNWKTGDGENDPKIADPCGGRIVAPLDRVTDGLCRSRRLEPVDCQDTRSRPRSGIPAALSAAPAVMGPQSTGRTSQPD